MATTARFAAGVIWMATMVAVALPQTKTEKSATPPSDFAKEPFVLEMMHSRVRFERDGTGSRELSVRVKIQSETALREYGLLRFAYASKFETASLDYVRVRKSSGEMVETATADAQDVDSEVSRQAPMYTDQREKHLAVKALATGDVLEYHVTWKVHDAVAPGHFWIDGGFTKGVISLDEELEFDVPHDLPAQLFSRAYAAVVKDQDGRRVYKLRHANLKREEIDTEGAWEKGVGLAPPSEVQLTSFSSWEQVGKWFEELESPQQAVTPQIRAKAEEITRGKTTDTEKIRALYDFVSLNFRYIGISLGLARYTPHKAEDVLANRYGDCKDKHTLFAALLAAEGIKGYPALISSTEKIDDKIPSPSEFDHVITAIPKGDGYEFLDTTAEVAGDGYLIGVLRDKAALVVIHGGPARLVRTPATPPGANSESYHAEATLDNDGTLDGKSGFESHGDSEFLLRTVFRATPESRWNELVQNMSERMGFGGTVSEVAVTRPEALEETFRLTYSYHRTDYSDWKERQILLPMPPIVLPGLSEKRKALADPVVLGSPVTISYEAGVKLPKGMTPHLPQNVNLANDFAIYSSSYTFKDGVVRGSRSLQTRVGEITGAQRAAYSAMVKALITDQSSFMPLESDDENSDSYSSGNVARGHSDNEEAQRLVEQAFQAMQLGAPYAEVTELEKAVKLDPKFVEAWEMLGSARMMVKQSDRGVEAFQKAALLDPKNVQIHRLLATAQIAAKREGDAIATWREVLKLSPGDSQALERIAALLLQTKRYSEAVTFLLEQEKSAVNSPEIHRELGEAYLGSGDPAKGMEVFHKALELERTPIMLNSVAYSLAESKYNLQEALSYADEAVRKTEEDSAKTEDGDRKARQLTVNMAAEWDTVGWVKYQLEDYEGATKYLEAAWRLMQAPVVGEHLGELYEKTGKKHQALELYAMALNAVGVNGDANLRQKLSAKVMSLKASGAKMTGDVGGELSAIRSYKLELPKGWSGFGLATTTITLVNGQPDRTKVVFVSGSNELRDFVPTVGKVKLRILFPDERAAKVVESGLLSCSQASRSCTLVLKPVEADAGGNSAPSVPAPVPAT